MTPETEMTEMNESVIYDLCDKWSIGTGSVHESYADMHDEWLKSSSCSFSGK